MTRRISLPLAADTTDTHCGSCRADDDGRCEFVRDRYGAPGRTDRGKRLPECLAAEREHAAMIERPSEDDIAAIRDGIYGDDRMSRETLNAALEALDRIGGRS